MSKNLLFAAAVAVFLAGSAYVFSGTATCTPSRADILTSANRGGSPSCTPSRADILGYQAGPR
jgi:hypothetical protein